MMSNYTVKITCPLSLERIYDAITKHMSDWWTPMSAPFLKVGDIAKTDFGGEAYWVFESTTLKHPSLIELTCLESNFLHPTMGGGGIRAKNGLIQLLSLNYKKIKMALSYTSHI